MQAAKAAGISTTANVCVKSVDEDSVKTMNALETLVTLDERKLCADCAQNDAQSSIARPA